MILKIYITLTSTLDSQKIIKAFIIKTCKRTLIRVSNLCYNESVVLSLHHFTYATQRQQNQSNGEL
jgi:hypothetical protein